MAKKAFIVWGGWDGHQPKQVGEIFDRILKEEGFETEVSDSLEPFADEARMKTSSSPFGRAVKSRPSNRKA